MVKDKIAILGASGFIGMHLCKKLVDEDISELLQDNDGIIKCNKIIQPIHGRTNRTSNNNNYNSSWDWGGNNNNNNNNFDEEKNVKALKYTVKNAMISSLRVSPHHTCHINP